MIFIYYAHPVETYQTYIEDFVEELVKKKFGEVLHIKDWFSLRQAVSEKACEELKDLFAKIRRFVIQREKDRIPETDAKSIAHTFMKVVGTNITAAKNVLFNPSTFGDPFLAMAKSETFKRKAYPHFCYGLIDYCDVVVAHGYVMDAHTKCLFKAWFKMRSPFHEVTEYCKSIIKLLNKAKSMIWSPGTCEEIKYSLNKGKEIFCLQNKTLQKITSNDINLIDAEKVPFDKYGLKLYNKIWQPIAESVYKTLTILKKELS